MLKRLISVGGVAALSLVIAGCSTSTGPAESSASASSASADPSASAPASATPSQTSSPSASGGASDGVQMMGEDTFHSIPFEGTPAQWGEATVGGEDHEALIPDARESANGSIVWKNVGVFKHLEFSAATPDGQTASAPIVVKAITGDSRTPQVATVEPGKSQRLSLDIDSAKVVKIVWHVEGKPAQGQNIVFYDFDAK